MEIIPYNKKLTARARELRRQMTKSEAMLWQYLRGRKMLGNKFIRQHPIDNYIVDFYCRKIRLAIEVDGEIHLFQLEEDMVRQHKIEAQGVSFLRFSAIEVEQNIQGVLNTIEKWIISP
jgi:very-short-patch-repair endonuclease